MEEEEEGKEPGSPLGALNIRLQVKRVSQQSKVMELDEARSGLIIGKVHRSRGVAPVLLTRVVDAFPILTCFRLNFFLLTNDHPYQRDNIL